MEMKRDEMLLAFQREQAQQKRHKLMLIKLLLQSDMLSGCHTAPPGIGNKSSVYGGNNAMVDHLIGNSFCGHHLGLLSVPDQGQNVLLYLKIILQKYTISCKLLKYLIVLIFIFIRHGI